MRRLRPRTALLFLVLTLAVAACGSGAGTDGLVSSPTPFPAGSRPPLPTLGPVVPTPGVGPSPPPPTVPPPTPDVQVTAPLAPTRPPDGGPVPLPTLAPLTPGPAPTLPAGDVVLPREIGYDGGWWAVLFSPGARGNQANGHYILDRLIAYMEAARSSIHVAAFETDLTPLAEALVRANARGVDVRWVTDDANGVDADFDEGRGQFALMEDAGIPIRDDLRSAFMHNKFIIIDGRILWTGSMNLTTNDFYRNNNNTVVVESPEVAAVFETEFQEMWSGQFGPRSPAGAGQDVFDRNQRPFIIRFAPEDEPLDALAQLAGLAEESIHFMAFSFTHDELGAVMRERVAAGVDVRGIFETFGSETPYSEMGPLYCAGAAVRQDGNPGMLHHKVIVIDETVVVTGSLNFSNNAADSNDENILILADAGIARLYMEEFTRRWAEGRAPVGVECP